MSGYKNCLLGEITVSKIKYKHVNFLADCESECTGGADCTGIFFSLTAWLHITNACPLGCHYCYIQKSNDQMTLVVGRQAVQTVFQEAMKHGYTAVTLKYAGGEPTLNLCLVEELHHYAYQLAQQHGLQLDEVLLTSGVMSAQGLQRLIAMNIRVMVSLDGLAESDNNSRPLLSGKPTAHLAQETLIKLKQAGIQVVVSITVTRQSADSLIKLIEFLLAWDIPFSLSFARDNAAFLNRDQFMPHNQYLIKTMTAIINHFSQNLPRRSLLHALTDRANLSSEHYYTCSVGRNYLVIDYQGNIAMCQQEMKTPITSIYEADPLLKIINNEKGIKNLHVDEKEGCRDCEWKYACTGGCAALTTQVYGRADTRSPFCEVYKAVLPQVVALEEKRQKVYELFVVN